MTRFARFLETFKSARKLEANRLIHRYSYLVDQARAHEEKEKLEEANKLAAAAPSQPSFMAGTPLCSP